MYNAQNSSDRHRLLAHAGIAILVIIGIIVTEYVQGLVVERTRQIREIEAIGILSQLRAQLETEINSVLYLSSGLISYVTVRPDSDPEEWKPLAAELVRGSSHVRNIGLAPDNILSFIYPLIGNERALGLNYRENNHQWPAVKAAIDAGHMVLAGPLELVQGGLGLIARTPIYTRRDEDGSAKADSYWGLASVVIDAESLFRAAGVKSSIGDYEIAIRGKDGTGRNGEMVLGRAELFDQPLAELPVVFPHGHWVMVAQPHAQSIRFWAGPTLVRLVAYTILLTLTLLLWLLVRLYHSSRGEAMHDPLTGLPNRRLLMERITQLATLQERTGLSFALYFLDLNDFKPINDRFGHAAGDAVLREVGRRLSGLVRISDSVARTGGDEFMILQPAVSAQVAARAVIGKIEQAMAEPFFWRHQEFKLSAAVGVAIYPRDADSVEQLIMLADAQMYERKAEMKTGN